MSVKDFALDILVEHLLADPNDTFFKGKSVEEAKTEIPHYWNFYGESSGKGWNSVSFGALAVFAYDLSTRGGQRKFRRASDKGKVHFTVGVDKRFDHGVIDRGEREGYGYVVLGWTNLNT